MRILVCGSRYWTDEKAIRTELEKYKGPNVTLITGGCRGADELAEKIGGELGFTRLVFPADWVTYGRSAGPIRNRKMLEEGKPDLILAFHEDLEQSKGTKNMLSIATKAKVPVTVFS